MPRLRQAAAEHGIDYRPAEESDLPFLTELYVAGRLAELDATDWPIETKRAFLQQQHRFRESQYRLRFPELEALVITRDAKDIGHLALSRHGDAIRLVDIALTEEERGRGIGAAIVADLVAEAVASGQTIELSVEAGNRARRLYERAGFRVGEDGSAYLAMSWTDDRRSNQ